MTEKKTFKNVLVGSAHTDGARIEWLVSGEGVYSAAEWDMEVTFTKKSKPIQQNTWVEDECGCPLFVLGLRGQFAWVTGEPNNLDLEDDSFVPDLVVRIDTLTSR